MKILITGSNGFLGKGVVNNLKVKHDVTCGTRYKINDSFSVGNLSEEDYIAPNLNQFDIIIHLAAKAHVFGKDANNINEFKTVNVESTLKLARSAARSGVERFIYLSSIGVNGINSHDTPFTEDMATAPHDPYSASKLDAEEGLKSIAKQTGLDVVIIRPPLIYGPSAPGNFSSLMKLVKLPIPLPFSSVKNRRSFIFIKNISSFIERCIDHPDADNQTFLIADGQDTSLPALVTLIRSEMGQSPMLIPVPTCLLKLVGQFSGKSAVVERLTGNLQVNKSKASDMLDWKPPYTFEEGIRETVKDFMKRNK